MDPIVSSPFNKLGQFKGSNVSEEDLIPEGDPYATPDIKQEKYGEKEIIRFPDGSAAFRESAKQAVPPVDQDNHFVNLTHILDPIEISRIGYTLKEAVESDIESQESYFNAVADAIGSLGLNIDEDGGDDLPFKGASNIKSTALFESALDMLSMATSSLFPPTGMVDCVINGETTQELEDRAYRKKVFFNFFLTQVVKEFKKESRKAIFWAILTGSCYKKVYIDPIRERPTSQFIKTEDFIVNAKYSTHLGATRKTHILRMNQDDFKARVRSKKYRDTNVIPDEDSEESGIQSALDSISGIDRQNTSNPQDNFYKLYEIHVDYRIPGDPKAEKGYKGALPYIITIDSKSGFVVDICRNWSENDPKKKKIEYFVNYSLLPSLEGEGYGLVHYAGNLAKSATAIKRQLIDAGTFSNFPGGIYSAGIRLENNILMPNPGEYIPLQTGGMGISDVLQSLPYKEPSQALGELLTNIEESIKRPSAIINSKVSEMTPQAPVGSVLAMLESLHRVPNAVLEGFHESFGQELMLFNSRIEQWLPEDFPYMFKVPGGQHNMMKKDFDDDVKVIPASNPALQNSSYRFMQSEIILNQARQGPDIHNLVFAYEYFYKNLGLSPEDIKKLLPTPEEAPPPFSGDPVSENAFLLTGKPVAANITQEHDAHILVHQLILSNQNLDPSIAAATQAHIQEHEAFKFIVSMQQEMGMELPSDPSQLPPEMQNQIAIQAAQIAQQRIQQMQEGQQPVQPPLDPSAVALEIEQIRAQQRRESDLNKIELEKMKLSLQENKTRTEMSLAESKLAQDKENTLLKQEFEMKKEEIRAQQKAESDALKIELEKKKLEIDLLKQQNDIEKEQEEYIDENQNETPFNQQQ